MKVQTTFVNGVNPFLAYPKPEPKPVAVTGVVFDVTAGKRSYTDVFSKMKQGDVIKCEPGQRQGRNIANLFRRYLNKYKLLGLIERNTQDGFIYWK